MKKINLIKLSVILTTAFIFLIGIVAVFLPLLVTLYVEKTGRLEILATTIMITCYPCAPFTVLSLWYLRKVLKNFLAKNYLAPENEKYLK